MTSSYDNDHTRAKIKLLQLIKAYFVFTKVQSIEMYRERNVRPSWMKSQRHVFTVLRTSKRRVRKKIMHRPM